ncbi:M24 family metallopeptidase [Patulibacter defluvii]|uniref:M24 family metallopeptidase n=1 Tax=Patulibacter defluvii TaxID=3095358 RepID=UPI002A74A426|nr:M24 family metallopeptidase [Patulibacter sp. DM4]
MPDVLIYADSERTPELRHEIPAAVGDPFLYGEREGRPFAVVSALDAGTIGRARPDLELLPIERYGVDELLAAGVPRWQVYVEASLRAAREQGIVEAAVPAAFPLAVADYFRAGGLGLNVDPELFDERRRTKSAAELAGIRRAQTAADAAARLMAGLLAGAEIRPDGALWHGGAPLTCEAIKAAIDDEIRAHGATADEYVVAHGPQSADAHGLGSGPIAAGEPVVLDIWPRDRATGCFTDMARTWVVGMVPERVASWHALCLDAHQRVLAEARAGVDPRDLYATVCDVFEAGGHATQRTKPPGTTLEEGFFSGLGHGVGLEVHEAPSVGRAVSSPLIVGDVVALEPNLCYLDVGRVQLEDAVLIGEDGCELLGAGVPYDLDPAVAAAG